MKFTSSDPPWTLSSCPVDFNCISKDQYSANSTKVPLKVY
ncbi:hypothetical protein QF023_001038 [Chryseobacterium sp. SLBN-27]|nr:hypothetical protein [Chryseobacterium sp. SLBN-27]